MFAGFTWTDGLDGTVELADDGGPGGPPQPATQSATAAIDAYSRTRC
jgi:hypothetical protein